MSRLEIIISALLALSLMFNIGFFIYARAVLSRLLLVSEELGDLQQMIDSFSTHLQSVYELDSFYGDETLHALLQHAISFDEYLTTFEYIYSLTDEENLQTNEETDTEKTQEAY